MCRLRSCAQSPRLPCHYQPPHPRWFVSTGPDAPARVRCSSWRSALRGPVMGPAAATEAPEALPPRTTGGAIGGSRAATGGAASGGMSGGGAGGSGGSESQPKFRVFLLIGQSNMAGGATPNEADRIEDERIQVLGFDDCGTTGRKYNEWDVASPPLHACWTNGIGPGDHFAKTLLAALPEGDTIGLIPSALPGAGIEMFRKGAVSTQRQDFFIPPDNHWENAYDWMVERARLAQDAGGVIEGMLFHQGETDNMQDTWPDRVAEMVDDLRRDLGLGTPPFIAGELLYGGCCQGHNPLVHQLPVKIENAFYVSAEGLAGSDIFHFEAAGVRTLGVRYADAMRQALGLGP